MTTSQVLSLIKLQSLMKSAATLAQRTALVDAGDQGGGVWEVVVDTRGP